MSKINIKSILKNENEIHIFEGKGIKNDNIITYNDNGVITKISLGETIFLERNQEYYIKLGFNTNKITEGTYSTKEGNFDVKVKTEYINKDKKSINIKYQLIINNSFIQNFEFYLQYTIDR